jgi:hypothetical protein
MPIDIPPTCQCTLKHLEKGDVIVETTEFDDGVVSSVWFYKILRINKKTITVQSCSRSGSINNESEIKYLDIWSYNPKLHVSEQTWDVLFS